jgi:Restriction Enzyme Adenine Methylase Associated/Type I restriction enzyme R protein N terminus (HSDR_N)
MDAFRRRSLAEAAAKVRSRIDSLRERGESIGEQDTKATLIEPVLAALGWNLEELDDVRREFRRKPQDNPVDYALFVLRQPRLFVEAKPLGTNLDRKSAAQVLGYASMVGVSWCLVTNGDEYRLYNSHAAVDVDEKLFRVVKISDLDHEDYCLDTLSLLLKEAIGETTLESLWNSQFVDRRVQVALEAALEDEDGGLARFLRKRAPELTVAEIRESLRRADVRVSFPRVIPPKPAGESSARTGGDQPPGVVSPPPPKKRVRVSDLIDAGLIRAPYALEAIYKGALVSATIVENGTVVVGGAAFDSLSRAGGAAKATVNGTPTDVGTPATNGWTFWQYRDEGTGELMPVEQLLERLPGLAG